MKNKLRYCRWGVSAILSFCSLTTYAQVYSSVDQFSDNTAYYIAFNSGTGTLAKSNSTGAGITSLQVDYTNATASSYFTVFKTYTTSARDFSFMVDKFSLRHKGGSANTTLQFRLWEDLDMDGTKDAKDELFICSTVITTGQTSWTVSEFKISDFTRESGTGNDSIDLNRIRAWDVVVKNTAATSQSGQIFFDELLLHSTYTPPSDNGGKITGSFTQLWNTVGCSCGTWTLQQWQDQFQKMKDACMTTFVVQYGVYSTIISWYTPTSFTSTPSQNTLNLIMQAAADKGIGVYIGLYFDETWNTANKSSATTYSALLTKQQKAIDDIYNLFGGSSAFKGWYIPQEINDLEWKQDPAKSLLFSWMQSVASYAHSKPIKKKVMIAAFFNLWMPADTLATWYDEFFKAAPDIDQFFPQDGVGITLKDVYYHVPLYYSKIKEVCDANGVEFGATVESFQQLTGWPIDNGGFTATSTDIIRLQAQLWETARHSPVEVIQFEWAYMQPSLNTASTTLYNDYLNYSNCTANEIHEMKEEMLKAYPNPVSSELSFSKIHTTVMIYSIDGKLVFEKKNTQKVDLSELNQGIYIVHLFDDNKQITYCKIAKE